MKLSAFILHPSSLLSFVAEKPKGGQTATARNTSFTGKLEIHQHFDGSRFAYGDACELRARICGVEDFRVVDRCTSR
jgi:hypothetical protein